jgi:hypothetical protein
LWAQQGSTGGVQFVSPLRLAVGTDNNFQVDRTDPNEKLFVLSLPPSIQPAAAEIKPKVLDDKFFTLTLPKIAYQNESRRHELVLTWVPEFEFYRENTDQNAMSQEAAIGFSHFLSRNMQIAVGDVYRTSRDPARMLQNVFLLLPRGPYKENAFRASFDIQPNAITSVGVRYDTNYTKFGQTDPFQARILDSTATGYTFSLTRMTSRNSRLRGVYSIFTMKPIERSERNDDAVDTDHLFERTTHAASLQYKFALDRGTIISAAGGVIRLEDGWNYTFQGILDKRLATYYWLGASYSRALTYLSGPATGFAQGLGSNGFYDVIFFRFSGQPSRRTNILLSATLSRSVANRIIESNKAIIGRARFDYRLSDRNVLFASMETYQQNQNLYVQSPLARNRFSVGLEISLSSEAQRRLSNLNEDGRYVPLTEHARQRGTPDQED